MSGSPIVLIVEDDQDIQQLIEFSFESHGFTTVVRNDGAEALSYLDETGELPALIVLDIQMPDVDGREFLRRRADTERLASIPVIVLTSLDNEETANELFELGAEDYVTKPFSTVELRSRANRLLDS